MSYIVKFWQSGVYGIPDERYSSKREAAKAIAEFVREGLDSVRYRHCFVREGRAADGSVVVKHKSGGREFGAYWVEVPQ